MREGARDWRAGSCAAASPLGNRALSRVARRYFFRAARLPELELERLEVERFDDERFDDECLALARFDDEARFEVERFADERFADERFAFDGAGGTLSPSSRASDSPIAIACSRLFTVPPCPCFPRLSVPLFRRRIALSTRLPAAGP